MALVFFVSMAWSYDTTKYVGTYSTNVTFPNGTSFLEKASLAFRHNHVNSSNYNASEGLSLILEFADGKYIKLGSLAMCGFGPDVNNTYFFYTVFPATRRALLMGILSKVIKTLEEKQGVGNFTHLQIYAELQKVFSARLQAAIFTVQPGTPPANESTFLKHVKANGVFYMNQGSIRIEGFEFDEESFVSEGKVFGVVVSIGLFMSYTVWLYISKAFESISQLSQLSLHSFILHLAYDFSYAVFVFHLSELNTRFTTLYTLIFGFMLCLYIMVEMKMVLEIWRASISNAQDLDQTELRELYMDMFFELTIVLFIMAMAASLVFESPFVCVSILYIFFFPQIVHSAQSPVRKTRDTWFTIVIGCVRLIPVFYFTLYKHNIMGTYSVSLCIYAVCLVSVQVIVVILQNIFGGAFFLRPDMRPRLFDYRAERPEPGTECVICMGNIEEEDSVMTTPCHHSFHEECLSRWMEEQMICPICRSHLPGSNRDEEATRENAVERVFL